MIWSVVGGIAGVVSLVCYIMEVVTAFQKGDGPLLGVLSLIPCCSLGGFIIGWVKCNEWGLNRLMLVWSIAMVVSFVASLMHPEFGLMAPGAVE